MDESELPQAEVERRAQRYRRIALAAVLAFSLHGLFLVNAIEHARWIAWAAYVFVAAGLVLVFVIESRQERKRRARSERPSKLP